MDDFGARTEAATPRKRREARRDGLVARSADLASAVTFAGAALAAGGATVWLVERLGAAFTSMLETTGDAGTPVDALVGALTTAGRVAIPALVVIWFITAAAAFVQVGPLVAPAALRPQLERIDPFRGLRRLLGGETLVRAALDVAKTAAIVLIVAFSVRAAAAAIVTLPYRAPGVAATIIGEQLMVIGVRIVGVLLVGGVIDFAYQRWRLGRDLRMTREELRDEMKQEEGDPAIRQRRRRKVSREDAGEMPRCDLVIHASGGPAVAIAYDRARMTTPRIVAFGRGPIAVRIEAAALARGVAVLDRPALARALAQSGRVGQPVPEALYVAVAEALAAVQRRTKRHADEAGDHA